MKSFVILISIFLIFTSTAFCESWPTLKEVCEKNGIDLEGVSIPNLDQNIHSYKALNDDNIFCIAYYLTSDRDKDYWSKILYVSLLRKGKRQWFHRTLNFENFPCDSILEKSKASEVGEIDFHAHRYFCSRCCRGIGSVTRIHYSRNYFYLGGHSNPSACFTLVLTKDLDFYDCIYGWVLAIFGDEIVAYHNSQVHFAPTHYSEISLYNPGTKLSRKIYPMKPYQNIRLNYIRKVRTAYEKKGEDWFRINNHHMNPELFNNGIRGKVVVNDNTDSLAFIIVFNNRDTCDSKIFQEYTEVMYIYKNVKDDKQITYKEILLSDLKERYGDIPISKYLEAQLLKEIFKI